MADPSRSMELLVEAMNDQDRHLANWAINLTPYATDMDATEKLVALLHKQPPESKILMLYSLGKRGDPLAATSIIEVVKSEKGRVRQAALESLGSLSGDQAVDTLLEVATNGNETEQRIARASLAHIVSAETRLAEMARTADERLAVEALRALASRKAKDQSELVLQLARDKNPSKRTAAIEATGILIDAKAVNSLVKLALEDKQADDLKEIERALSRVLQRIDSPDERAKPLLEALPSAPSPVRPMLIRQLSKAGTSKRSRLFERHKRAPIRTYRTLLSCPSRFGQTRQRARIS